MTAPKKRSEFAQALYNLMISPGIYPIEEWCAFIDPWVEYKTEQSTLHTFGPEAYGAPKTMALIQSWFDDKALPTSEEMRTILDTCKEGHKAIGMAHLFSLEEPKPNPEFDAYLERFKKGREMQEKALDDFYEILDKLIWDVSPIGRGAENKMFEERVGLFPHYKLHLEKPLIEGTISRLFQVPTRHIKSVLWQIVKTIMEAEKNNWYEKTPDN